MDALRRAAAALALALAPLAACGGGGAPAGAPAEASADGARAALGLPARPSVLLVSVDTLAARHLSLHGYERPTSPRLDALAREAVVFERCWANAPWTVESYLSQLTGLYPGAHRLRPKDERRRAPAWEKHRLADERATLAERFRAAGWRTACFWQNPWLGADLGFEQGFETYAGPDGDELPGLAGRAEAALAWLDGLEGGAPWLLVVQGTDPHAPYRAPPPFGGRFAAEAARAPSRTWPVAAPGERAFGKVPHHVALGAARDGRAPAALDERELVAAYDEEVLAADAALGRLLDGLATRGLLDEAVVVVSADHGESMAEHGFLFGHGVLDETDLHVPLVVRLPDGARGGARVAQPVQLVDLVPTLLELAGLPVPGGLHGRSLVPVLEGAVLPPRPLFAQGGIRRQRAVRLGRWKLVEIDPTTQPADAVRTDPLLDEATRARILAGEPVPPLVRLFDLEADPGERVDLAAEHPERVAALRRLLAEELARAEAARVEGGGEAARAPDAAALEELRRLGYAEELR